MKIGILTTHPIQYQVPWFRALVSLPDIDLTVFFCMFPDSKQQGEGFGVAFEWDVPLLDGYHYRVLENISPQPAVGSFKGCDTPGIDRIVRDEGFDAFIVNGWVVKSCLQLLWACNKNKVPCVVRGESNNLRPRVWWKRLLHNLLLNRYSAFLYIGEGNRRFYLENGVAEEKLFFAPYCIENERFAKMSEELKLQRESIREAWGIPRDAVTFLFCGKFQNKKRPMDCLRALQLIKARDAGCGTRDAKTPKDLSPPATGQQPAAEPLHLLMVGTGELLDECKSFANEHNLPVTFAGFLNQSEIPKAYVASDCQILPSDNGETWGLVVNEGMACGLSAIVSDQVGCHLNLIKDGETGWVYPCGDVVALSDRMRMVADKEVLERSGVNARGLVSGHNYDVVVNGTLSALDYVLGRH